MPILGLYVYVEAFFALCSLSHTLHLNGEAADVNTSGAFPSHKWELPGPILDISAMAKGQSASANVYLLRHGETDYNRAQTKDSRLNRDSKINSLGVKQALAAQQICRSLGLFEEQVSPANTQIAASTLSRAFDTAIIATAPLWRRWLQDHDGNFMVHEIPAADEFGLDNYSSRVHGLEDDDPVRWKDSVLSGDLAAEVTMGDAQGLFYKTVAGGERTSKPAQVRTDYQRHNEWACQKEQMRKLKQYIVHSALSGKEHILIGTHGGVLLCLALDTLRQHSVSIDNSSDQFWLHYQALPNAGLLHLHLTVALDEDFNSTFESINSTFVALRMYSNPAGGLPY